MSITYRLAGTKEGGYDALIVVGPNVSSYDDPAVVAAKRVDAKFGSAVELLASESADGGRLVLASTGSLSGDYEDVRTFADAAKKAIRRAKSAGAVKPVLKIDAELSEKFKNAVPVAILGAFAGLYEPLQAREALGESISPVKELGIEVSSASEGERIARIVRAIEDGKVLARDIGGADPERMTPLNCASYIEKAFEGTSVQVEVIKDQARLLAEYPLLSAVARCSQVVERHIPTVVRLRFLGGGEVDETLLLAGKGVIYDTGGADLKVGGAMVGMRMDKCGAAAVAGFILTLARLGPNGIGAVAELGFVRNSIGADAYVADEIIASHAGVRVLVGNTDAEGRMVLSDCLSHLRQQALESNFPNPRLMTCATLTGHAARAVGHYPIALDNGPALAQQISLSIQRDGEAWGEPFEVSRLRKEDFEFVAPKSSAYDVLQCNTQPSSVTARGHQFPMAMIAIASGVNKHGLDSEKPLCYTHLDIAGASIDGDFQTGNPTAVPITALTARFVLPRLD